MTFTHKKFITITMINVFILTFILHVLVFLFSTSDALVWINTLKEQKYHAALSSGGKNKIVFNSGSNTLFGINTKEIQKQIGVPTYNLAIHGGLGPRFIFEESKSILKPGDIVIVPLEYDLYYRMSKDGTKLEYDYYRVYDKEKLSRFSIIQKAKYVFQLDLKQVLKETRYIWSVSDLAHVGYGGKNINENGDQINIIGSKEDRLELVKPFKLPEKYGHMPGLEMVKEFSQWCKDNGIRMFITYPNSMYFEEFENNEYKEFFAFLQSYFSRNGIAQIGDPYSNMYNDRSLFYDTQYHMNQKGMTLRTDQIIEQLRNLKEVRELQEKY